MAIEIFWDNEEKTVVCLKLLDGWSWKELYEGNQQIVEMMTSVDQPVHLLIDHTSNAALPTNGIIMHARNILGAYPANCELRVIVTPSMLALRMVSAFQMTFKSGLGKHVFSAKTREEAYRRFVKRSAEKLAS